MTSNIAGIEPTLPTGNRSFPLPPIRTASHDPQQTPRSWPRQTLIPTPNAPASSQDISEPALKRQKIGGAAIDLVEKTSGTLRSALDVRNATSSTVALLTNGVDFSVERKDSEKQQQLSLFPVRPQVPLQPGGNQQGRALAIERATARDVVPVKPYVPEPPSFAPRLHKAGSCPSDFAKACMRADNSLRASRLFPVDRMSCRGCP